MKIDAPFRVVRSKIVTEVKLVDAGNGSKRQYDAIFDPGSSITTISSELFATLEYKLKDVENVRIIGVNNESRGISTVIDYFEIGGVNLGAVRIVVGKVHPNFQNNIILGMNVLLWYNLAINHENKRITLVERRNKQSDLQSRFTRRDVLV